MPPQAKQRPGDTGGPSPRGYFFMILLAFQFGAQPLLNRWYIAPGVVPSSIVGCQEILKLLLALFMLQAETGFASGFKGWTLKTSLLYALLPAAIYALQNVLMWLAAANMDGLSYNLINQSKIIWTAVFVYLLVGKPQSREQCGALALLFATACILSFKDPEKGKESDSKGSNLWLGIIPLLVASGCSGFASGLSQLALRHRNSFVFTIELSVFSFASLLVSLLFSADGELMRTNGIFAQWTHKTIIPVLSNAAGGIFVGQVVKYAGGVQKGFSIILALIITTFLQWLVLGDPIGPAMLIALPLGVAGVYIHTMYPPKPPKPDDKTK